MFLSQPLNWDDFLFLNFFLSSKFIFFRKKIKNSDFGILFKDDLFYENKENLLKFN